MFDTAYHTFHLSKFSNYSMVIALKINNYNISGPEKEAFFFFK